MGKLQPHQQRVVDKVTQVGSPHGLIAYHSLGSGKTYTALATIDKVLANNPGKRALMVTPASLVTNAQKEIDKHNLQHLHNKIDLISYDRAAKYSKYLASQNYAISVFDEAHRLRNDNTKRVSNLKKVIDRSGKVLFLTGTAGYNHPSDITSLVNLIEPTENLPNTHTQFEHQFIDNRTWKLKNEHRLREVMHTYVDKYDTPTNSKDFPTVSRRIIHVPMSPKQRSIYRTVERDIPEEIRSKMRNNLPVTLQEANKLNFFSTGVRQVANTPMHHDVSTTLADSPKIQTAVNNMVRAAESTPGFRGVAYSNFLDAGLVPYETALKEKGIKPLVFTGSMNAKQKADVISRYNSKSKKPQVLLVSSSGGEGLDLKRTRLVQILEPHFNKSKIDQVEGRAARFKSHEDLPEKDRNVKIEEYRSVLPKSTMQRFFNWDNDTAIDDYLSTLAERKQGIVDDINKLNK